MREKNEIYFIVVEIYCHLHGNWFENKQFGEQQAICINQARSKGRSMGEFRIHAEHKLKNLKSFAETICCEKRLNAPRQASSGGKVNKMQLKPTLALIGLLSYEKLFE
jgi:hypothetical protein